MNAEQHESKHVTADPLTDHPSSLETEVRVLKQIIRALVPDRHALGIAHAVARGRGSRRTSRERSLVALW